MEPSINDQPTPPTTATTADAVTGAWRLVFADEFNSTGGFDASKWVYCPRQTSAWNKYLTSSPNYVSQDGANLVLKMDNAVISGDNVPYHSGGVQTATKFNLRYGKVEVRAKFKKGQGSWPAIWMMPETSSYGGWPNSGEIDIMEHVNYENVIYNTIHNGAVTGPGGGSTASRATAYNSTDYNLYGMVWTPSAIEFYVNNVLTYTYSKAAGATSAQWPFDKPFYLILNQAGGAGWPGPITNADLPFNMQVDWVRVYKQEELVNPGLESATLAPWVAGPTTSVVTTNARTGAKAIALQGGTTTLEQTVTGLLPNTTYTFGGFGKVAAAGTSAILGVKGYGGTPVDSQITGTSYQQASVTFTTGASNTSATVYYYKPATGTVYGDDFYLNKQ
ncbi:family 16 glycosylhydrolase (plasmid) [Hymenobacter tibetensis]|uniref:Family 16 glycosylhydrolase n=1 Tax=Hymenobacter tibetensis TaxID=497967 RepID=A0ABY4D4C1_9BACT|nr:family 16 glycosylhydrolase [Hymenobacter tibetensis]UOG77374.1 family 16 glycosylhydrolase [Hymenobacter tibetensis]